MLPNVFIKVRERGKLKATREVHNTWTDPGRDYLRHLISLQTADPDTTTEVRRPKHLQLGVGGSDATVLPVDIDTAYPAGFDPHTTNGKQYNHSYPVAPRITTLERPIRVSGGTTPYPGDPGDVWLSAAALPGFYVTNPDPKTVALRYRVDLAGGQYLYAPFTLIPLTEMGIVLSTTADPTVAYNEVAAYVNFDLLELTSALELEVTWFIHF